MPDRPVWYAKIPAAVSELSALPDSRPVSPRELASALGCGERRAQQILQPLADIKVGRGKAAKRKAVLDHLRALGGTSEAREAGEEWIRFRRTLKRLEEEHRAAPPVLVEAPVSIQGSRIETLRGIRFEPGRIVVEGFDDFEGAKCQLLAMIFAIQRDPGEVERRIANPREEAQHAAGE